MKARMEYVPEIVQRKEVKRVVQSSLAVYMLGVRVGKRRREIKEKFKEGK